MSQGINQVHIDNIELPPGPRFTPPVFERGCGKQMVSFGSVSLWYLQIKA